MSKKTRAQRKQEQRQLADKWEKLSEEQLDDVAGGQSPGLERTMARWHPLSHLPRPAEEQSAKHAAASAAHPAGAASAPARDFIEADSSRRLSLQPAAHHDRAESPATRPVSIREHNEAIRVAEKELESLTRQQNSIDASANDARNNLNELVRLDGRIKEINNKLESYGFWGKLFFGGGLRNERQRLVEQCEALVGKMGGRAHDEAAVVKIETAAADAGGRIQLRIDALTARISDLRGERGNLVNGAVDRINRLTNALGNAIGAARESSDRNVVNAQLVALQGHQRQLDDDVAQLRDVHAGEGSDAAAALRTAESLSRDLKIAIGDVEAKNKQLLIATASKKVGALTLEVGSFNEIIEPRPQSQEQRLANRLKGLGKDAGVLGRATLLEGRALRDEAAKVQRNLRAQIDRVEDALWGGAGASQARALDGNITQLEALQSVARQLPKDVSALRKRSEQESLLLTQEITAQEAAILQLQTAASQGTAGGGNGQNRGGDQRDRLAVMVKELEGMRARQAQIREQRQLQEDADALEGKIADLLARLRRPAPKVEF